MLSSLRRHAAVPARARGARYQAKLMRVAALGALAAPLAAAAYVACAPAAAGAAGAVGALAAAAVGGALGAGLAAWRVGALLAPVTLSAGMLRAFLTRGAHPAAPDDGDAAGELLAAAREAVERLDELTGHAAVVEVATYDRLTGLPTRALFRDQLRHALAQARRDGRALGVLVLDVDGFRQVNASQGHAAGDALLAAVAVRLQAAVRDGDVVARLGADEFAVLCAGAPTLDGLDALARRVLEALARPFPVGGDLLAAGASVGVSVFPDDTADADDLLGHAAAALAEVQRAGGGAHRFYSAELNAELRRRAAVERDLRHALARGELALHYQPKVDVATRRVCGFEALLRWHHPERGLVSPAEFVPVAEATGLIVPVGAWVIGEACRQLARWRDAGLPPVGVAVNLSARQFRQGDLVATVRDALAAAGAEPHRLELEVTESLLLEDAPRTVAALQALRAAGVTISLDDFGTGYSSLGYLKHFPIDGIKLDRTFVHDATTDAQSRAITTAVLALGRSLGLTVVAEGVETEAQFALLAEHGCDVAQGFLFGRPVPPAEAARLLAAAGLSTAAGNAAAGRAGAAERVARAA